jgi:hypothetical protein
MALHYTVWGGKTAWRKCAYTGVSKATKARAAAKKSELREKGRK